MFKFIIIENYYFGIPMMVLTIFADIFEDLSSILPSKLASARQLTKIRQFHLATSLLNNNLANNNLIAANFVKQASNNYFENKSSDYKSSFDNQFEKTAFDKQFKKTAFDTRRIDQETQIIPRRNLQNYNRSEAFISEALSKKIKNLHKLYEALKELEAVYERENAWKDSYARVLLSTLVKNLRINQDDDDFSETQTGSLHYIEELLYVRYRISSDILAAKSKDELKQIILNKDEELLDRNIKAPPVITKSDVAEKGYDQLIQQLFGNVKADKDRRNVERTVTITIKDSYLDDNEVKK